MTIGAMHARREPYHGRNAAPLLLVLVLVLVAVLTGCSFERAFCGSESLACAAEADYSWIAAAD